MAFTPGKGSLLQTTQLTSNTSTFVSIAQVTAITPPPMEMGEVEVTHLGDTWRQFLPTVLNGGEPTFSLEWDPAHITHSEALTHFTTGSTRLWRTVFADTGTAIAEFSAFIKGFQIQEVTVDNVALVNLTLRTTSAITITT